MLAAICIGDELLDGRVRDRNAAHLADVASRHDWELGEVRIVADDHGEIIDALDELAADYDLVVVSGGLGPTGDDMTRQAAADWSERPLRLDEETLEALKRRFDKHGYTFTDNNRAQCEFPRGADILPTSVGTAGGFRLDHAETRVYFFPGVPSEFEWFVDEHLVADISASGDDERQSHLLTFIGIGESQLETRLEQIVDNLDDPQVDKKDVKLGFRADAPTNHAHISASSKDCLQMVIDTIRGEMSKYLASEQGQTPHARLGELLTEEQSTVAVAESCTAGGLGSRLTETPGSSDWFEYGFITYANRAKVDLLGVSPSTLEEEGAVSEATVRQMAEGARRRADSTYALSISGIAGPGGGTDEKPIGTVHFGLATDHGTYHRRINFPPRSRAEIRKGSIDMAVAMLLWWLNGHLMDHPVDGPLDNTSSTH